MIAGFAVLLVSTTVCVLADEYSELMRNEIGVRVLPLRIDMNSTELVGSANCHLTLHKGSCSSPAIQDNDTISWSTKICFQWKCEAVDHAMKVSNCWIGSVRNPVYLIREDGCTQESALLRSPSYHSFTRAISVGWLSVREHGMTHIFMQCDITLCHYCDPTCKQTTPPRDCRDSSAVLGDYDNLWNSSSRVGQLCNPPLEDARENSSSFLNPLFVVFVLCLAVIPVEV